MIPISYLNGHVYLHIFSEVIFGDLMIFHGDSPLVGCFAIEATAGSVR